VARPDLPSHLNDRIIDVVEPLIAIADLAGGDWPARGRTAVAALAGQAEDTDITVELLHDLRDIFESETPSATFMPSAVVVQKLCEPADRPWLTWRKGDRPLTDRGLARLLKPLGIVPVQHATLRVRGYHLDRLQDAFARYLL
jgi:hypothetical protein